MNIRVGLLVVVRSMLRGLGVGCGERLLEWRPALSFFVRLLKYRKLVLDYQLVSDFLLFYTIVLLFDFGVFDLGDCQLLL
jgi:hypothetical protein